MASVAHRNPTDFKKVTKTCRFVTFKNCLEALFVVISRMLLLNLSSEL